MGKEIIFNGETIKGLLIHGKTYAVQTEYEGFTWLFNEIGTVTRVLSEVCVDVRGGEERADAIGYAIQAGFMDGFNGKGLQFGKPKPKMEISEEEIDAAISSNEIYRRVRAELNAPQREQVGYGIQKYPELLNADTWTHIETIRHIKGELMDALHYLTMLEIKFEMMGEKDLPK